MIFTKHVLLFFYVTNICNPVQHRCVTHLYFLFFMHLLLHKLLAVPMFIRVITSSAFCLPSVSKNVFNNTSKKASTELLPMNVMRRNDDSSVLLLSVPK